MWREPDGNSSFSYRSFLCHPAQGKCRCSVLTICSTGCPQSPSWWQIKPQFKSRKAYHNVSMISPTCSYSTDKPQHRVNLLKELPWKSSRTVQRKAFAASLNEERPQSDTTDDILQFSCRAFLSSPNSFNNSNCNIPVLHNIHSSLWESLPCFGFLSHNIEQAVLREKKKEPQAPGKDQQSKPRWHGATVPENCQKRMQGNQRSI